MEQPAAGEGRREARRRFLKASGWLGMCAVCGAWVVATGRFFFPRVLFEPATAFTAGLPGEYKVGEVDTRYQESHKVWIVRTEDGFYALRTRCTHLGCTPVWDGGKQKFKCPCHGSGFTREGINYEGPAPRPLERVKITLADDGRLLVDTSVVFRHERGEWNEPESFLKM